MILLLDTSSPTCKLTLKTSDQTYDYEWLADRTLADNLIKYLRDKLSEHDMSWGDLTGVGVCKGPGSFTGLRIGLTVLNTIADSLRIPIVGETGDDWKASTVRRLKNGDDDKLVMPMYGREANITKPRK